MIYRLWGASAAATALALVTPATAQETATRAPAAVPANDVVPGEIIVTATKRAEAINKVPMSITAASGEQLSQAGIKDVAGLAKVVPGFNAVDSSYGSPVYYLRGVGFFETTLLAKPTVGVYMDEVPLPYSVMTSGASFDLERVEVLKGPQGTLFGSNATGGAINYVAAKPTSTWQAGLDGSFGRFATGTVDGYVSGPISDTLSFRVSANQELGGNWQRSTTRDAGLGKRDFLQGRVQLAWKPSDRFRANLMINAFQDHSDTQAAQLVGMFPQTVSKPLSPAELAYPHATDNARQADWGTTYPERKNNKMFQASLRMDYDVTNDITLTSLSSYSYFKEAQGQDSDGSALRLTDLFIDGKINSYFQEARLAGSFGQGGHWVVGGNYEHSAGPETDTQQIQDSTSGSAFVGLGLPVLDVVPQYSHIKYVSAAAFANVDYDIGSHITLHAGGRYTHTKTDFTGCVIAAGNSAREAGLGLILHIAPPPRGSCATVDHPTGPGSNGFGAFVGSLPEHNFSWRGGIDYKIDGNNLIYANVSRGYKSGSFSNLPGNDVNQYQPVKQEELTAYEVGVKSSLMDHKLQFNAAAFYYDYSNKQLKGRTNVPIFNFLEALVNIPKSWIKGGEVQLTAYPMRGLRFNIGGTYLDSKITSHFTNFTVFGQSIDFKGYGFSNTPHWQLNGDAEYKWAMGDIHPYLGASVTYRSKTNGDFKPDPRLAIDAYTLLDLRAGLEGPDGKWRVGLYGRNVTNQYYWTTAARRNDAVIRFAGMPATYGVDFSFRFR